MTPSPHTCKPARKPSPRLGHKDIDIQQLIEQAAAKGASRALAELGLDDSSAGRDITDLRALLTSWRRIKREITRSLIRFGIRAILLFMLLMAGFVVYSSGLRS
ncbi:MAG: DUF6127 family protein [Proteobacteria bacterium]|nr:DUF6127 family protein [Pseudomonadota bacterium]